MSNSSTHNVLEGSTPSKSLFLRYLSSYRIQLLLCVLVCVGCFLMVPLSWEVVKVWFFQGSAAAPIFTVSWIVFVVTSIFLPIRWWLLYKQLHIISTKRTTGRPRPITHCSLCNTEFSSQSEMNYGDTGVQCDNCYYSTDIRKKWNKAIMAYITAPLSLALLSLAIDFLLVVTLFALVSSLGAIYTVIQNKKELEDWSLSANQKLYLMGSGLFGLLVSLFNIITFVLKWSTVI